MTDLIEVEQTLMQKSISNLMTTDLDVSDFYCITVREYGIDFQGHYKSDLVRKLVEKGFVSKINSQGYIDLSDGTNHITLT